MATQYPWLMLGDCLERMKEIPDCSEDMILCDLLYGTTACKWDVVIPFEPLWEPYWRVIQPNGEVLLFGCELFSSQLRMSQIAHYKYDWVWKKNRPTGFMQAKRKPLRSYEIISVFGKFSVSAQFGKHGIYNLFGLRDSKRNIWEERGSQTLGKRKPRLFKVDKEGYPKDILEYKV